MTQHHGLKLGASLTYDPDKVWLSLEYPDSVRGSAKNLKILLDALRMDKVVSDSDITIMCVRTSHAFDLYLITLHFHGPIYQVDFEPEKGVGLTYLR